MFWINIFLVPNILALQFWLLFCFGIWVLHFIFLRFQFRNRPGKHGFWPLLIWFCTVSRYSALFYKFLIKSWDFLNSIFYNFWKHFEGIENKFVSFFSFSYSQVVLFDFGKSCKWIPCNFDWKCIWKEQIFTWPAKWHNALMRIIWIVVLSFFYHHFGCGCWHFWSFLRIRNVNVWAK